MAYLRIICFLSCTALLVSLTALVSFADTTPKSTLKKGDVVGAFHVTKVAGANEDGVERGQEVCYRCRYGSRPMVMVFTRVTGGQVPKLIKELDKAVERNQDAELRGLVTLMGKDHEDVKEKASKVAEKSGAKHVPFVMAKETQTGPENYKLSEKADVTIVVASESQVVSTHVFKADQIDIAMVMKEVNNLLY